MIVENEKQPIEQIKKLNGFLSESSKEEIQEIFAYWEKMKKKWEILKQKFRAKHDRADFLKLLRYESKATLLEKLWGLLKNNEEWEMYLKNLSGLERERFIEEYLHDIILYSGKVMRLSKKEVEGYSYSDWQNRKVNMKRNIVLFMQ